MLDSVSRACIVPAVHAGYLYVTTMISFTGLWGHSYLLVLSQRALAHLTRVCMQLTQMMLITTRPILPTRRPEFLMASGMARIPVPMLPFKRWTMVSQFLKRMH